MQEATPASKTCTKCGEAKPLEGFGRDRNRRDGLNPWCKCCNAANARRYGKANREAINAKQKAKYAADPESVCAKVRAYAKANPEIVNAGKRTYYRKNRDRLKAAQLARYWRDPAESRRRQRVVALRRRLRDPERYRLEQASWAAVRRAREAAVLHVPFTPEQLAQRLAYFGGKCWMCGATGTSVDHVKPIVAGGPSMLSNFRPACRPCNSGKAGRWPYAPKLKDTA